MFEDVHDKDGSTEMNSIKSIFKVFQSKLSGEDEVSLAQFAAQFFDSDYYKRKYLDLEGSDFLQHWLIHGRLEQRSPHPLVDIAYYREFNPDVPIGDELRHYLAHGWKEGRAISPFLRSDLFRETNPEWVHLGISPLEFLCVKLKNGEDIATGLLDTRLFPNSMGETPLMKLANYTIAGLGLPFPSNTSIGDMNPLEIQKYEEVTKVEEPNDWIRLISVVIPIHTDHKITRAMLDRIAGAIDNHDADIILVLDGADDSITSYANSLERPGIRILKHSTALGFSRAVNAGIKLAMKDRHVLILNADVLPRLQTFTLLYEALLSDTSLASVTAVTNFGSLASYPNSGQDGRWLPEHPDLMSKAFESDGFEKTVTLSPTCVGHCVLLRRSAIDDVGYFDAKNFPEGYGEEVDWSIRANEKNWQHGIANRAFVWHQGSTSFKERKIKLLRRGEQVLQSLHGANYDAVKDLARKTKSELTYRYQHLDAHLVKTFRTPKNAVLTHSSGGGTFEFIDRESQDLSKSVTLFFDRGSPMFRVSVEDYYLPALGLFPLPLEKLSDILVALGIGEIEVHTGVSYDSRLFFLEIYKFPGVKKIFLHDFAPFCARINLVGGLSDKPSFCGAPSDDAVCQSCVNKHGSLVGSSSIRDLREVVRLAFTESERLFVPHKNASEIWREWGFQTEVVKHNSNRKDWGTGITQKKLDASAVLDGQISKQISLRPRSLKSRPRVLIPGRISYVKGAELVREVLVLNRVAGSPLEFTLCGEIDTTILGDLTLFNSILGDYDKGLPSLAKTIEFDAVWLTSIWPETYMYVLDDLTDLPRKNALYLTSGMGAPIERSRGVGFQKVIEVDADPVRVFQKMLRDLTNDKK